MIGDPVPDPVQLAVNDARSLAYEVLHRRRSPCEEKLANAVMKLSEAIEKLTEETRRR